MFTRCYFNYNDFLERASVYPWLSEIARRYPGIRPGRCLSLYNALIDTVVRQRLPISVSNIIL